MTRIDFDALGDSLLRDARTLLAAWFPNGRLRGHEFVLGGVDGSKGESLSINVNTGKWADFASDERGGDLISLYAASRSLTQLQAARDLAGQAEILPVVGPTRAKAERAPPAWVPVLPVPENAPAAPQRFARQRDGAWQEGTFIRRWDYHDAEGRLLGHADRFEWDATDPETGEITREKDVVPHTYCKGPKEAMAWKRRGFPVPRPLYGLRDLAERPDAPVCIVEGEKDCDAARVLMPQYVVITWPGGCENWTKAAWDALRGHPSVLLWPDADQKTADSARDAKKYGVALGQQIPRDDQPGIRAMWGIGHKALTLVPLVKLILPEGVADGWGAADALAEGWTWERLKAWALPLVVTLNEGAGNGRAKTVVGVEGKGVRRDESGGSRRRDFRGVAVSRGELSDDVRARGDGVGAAGNDHAVHGNVPSHGPRNAGLSAYAEPVGEAQSDVARARGAAGGRSDAISDDGGRGSRSGDGGGAGRGSEAPGRDRAAEPAGRGEDGNQAGGRHIGDGDAGRTGGDHRSAGETRAGGVDLGERRDARDVEEHVACEAEPAALGVRSDRPIPSSGVPESGGASDGRGDQAQASDAARDGEPSAGLDREGLAVAGGHAESEDGGLDRSSRERDASEASGDHGGRDDQAPDERGTAQRSSLDTEHGVLETERGINASAAQRLRSDAEQSQGGQAAEHDGAEAAEQAAPVGPGNPPESERHAPGRDAVAGASAADPGAAEGFREAGTARGARGDRDHEPAARDHDPRIEAEAQSLASQGGRGRQRIDGLRSHDAVRVARVPAQGGDRSDPQAPARRTAVAIAEPAQQTSQVSRWLEWGLDRNGNGEPLTTLNNAVAVLEHDPVLNGLVWFDEFLQRLQTSEPPREWQEADDLNLALYMQRAVGLRKMGRDTVSQAVKIMAYQNPKNCARDWLSSLVHDGRERCTEFLCDVFGAKETAYTRGASANFWIGMVARVFQPGCQVDHMIVLEGVQGRGKSSAAKIIGGQWFAAQHESATNSRAFAEVLQGKMLIEIEEMHAFNRSETEAVKKAVSAGSDRFRPSGAHGYAKDHPRQCVFIGTTNKDDWNKDETGARRFWPIRCEVVELDLLKANREQYFAEAVARYMAGESWWVMPDAETKSEQQDRYDADPWLGIVSRFVETLRSITTTEIMIQALDIPKDRLDKRDQGRVTACLTVLGWKRSTERGYNGNPKPQKVWRPAPVEGEK